MSFTPKGIVVPIVTPVDQEGRLNEKAYRSLIDYLADNGIPVSVSVKGFEKPSAITEISLSGELKDVNSPYEPRKIAPVERKIESLDKVFAKPYSYTLVEVGK